MGIVTTIKNIRTGNVHTPSFGGKRVLGFLRFFPVLGLGKRAESLGHIYMRGSETKAGDGPGPSSPTTPSPGREFDIDHVARVAGALECAIQELKSIEGDHQCEHIKLLIQVYEWAMEEVGNDMSEGAVMDSSRMASLFRLLQLRVE